MRTPALMSAVLLCSAATIQNARASTITFSGSASQFVNHIRIDIAGDQGFEYHLSTAEGPYAPGFCPRSEGVECVVDVVYGAGTVPPWDRVYARASFDGVVTDDTSRLVAAPTLDGAGRDLERVVA
jgi:hypothetical protein